MPRATLATSPDGTFTTVAAPTPADTPKPTAAPTPVATPARRRRRPRPSPPQRPHPRPTDTGERAQPALFASTPPGRGTSRPSCRTFIRNAPNGSTIVFKAGGTYRLGKVVRRLGQEGHHARGQRRHAQAHRAIDFFGAGIFVEQLSEDITIRDLKIVGQHAAAGTKDALGGGENQNAIAVYGSTNTLIERVDIRASAATACTSAPHERQVWSDGVTFRDSTCRLTGRMGVTIIAGSRIRVVNNIFDEIGYSVVGIEPDAGNEGARDVVMRDNTVGSYSLTDKYEGALFYACNAPWSDGAVVRDVTVSGNTVAGNLAGKGGMRGLHLTICADVAPTNYTITNNTAAKAVAGPVLRIWGTNGVTVTGNKQPLSSGTLASFSGSTNVTYDG